jgi:hypothetical protein
MSEKMQNIPIPSPYELTVINRVSRNSQSAYAVGQFMSRLLDRTITAQPQSHLIQSRHLLSE